MAAQNLSVDTVRFTMYRTKNGCASTGGILDVASSGRLVLPSRSTAVRASGERSKQKQEDWADAAFKCVSFRIQHLDIP